MDIHIEKALPGDAETQCAVQREAFAELYERYRDENSPYLESADDIRRRMSHPDRDYYKIILDGGVIGGLTIRRLPDGGCYLGRLFVAPSMQGRGAGLQAVRLAEALYPDAMYWTVDFPSDLEANRRCYEAAGYRDTGGREVKNGALTLSLYEKGQGERIYYAARRDIPALLEVIRASFATVAQRLGLTEENASRNPAFMTRGGLEGEFACGGFFGLYIDGVLSGCARIHEVGDGAWELSRLAVPPSLRHKGYGRRLAEHALHAASEDGAEKVVIGIVEGEVLRGWYESIGFVHRGCKTYPHLPFTVGEMEYTFGGRA